jgi:nuclear GTP-binding protein
MATGDWFPQDAAQRGVEHRRPPFRVFFSDLLPLWKHPQGEKSGITVGFVGYPNVGKSSVINTLRSKKVCKTAPMPGETKVWQYISLTKKINLVDCPGVVYHRNTDSDTSVVLKGVVRVGNLENAPDHIAEVLRRVKHVYLTRAYKIKDWTSDDDFLEKGNTIV